MLTGVVYIWRLVGQKALRTELLAKKEVANESNEGPVG
jgi:hypothetical protein